MNDTDESTRFICKTCEVKLERSKLVPNSPLGILTPHVYTCMQYRKWIAQIYNFKRKISLIFFCILLLDDNDSF